MDLPYSITHRFLIALVQRCGWKVTYVTGTTAPA